MLSVKDIQITSRYSVDFLYIKIFLTDSVEDISNYTFNLYRSNNDEDYFELVGADLVDFEFLDYSVNLRDISTQYYYKVKIMHKDTFETYESDVFRYTGGELDTEGYYLVEVSKMQLEVVVDNQEMILLSKRQSGSLCPRCYDDIRRKPQNNCETCYNTNYVGGYHTQKKIHVVYSNPVGITEKFTPSTVSEDKSTLMLWTINFPLIQVNDILIDEDNNRYIVTSWQPSQKRGVLIRQTVQLQFVPRSSIIYKIPVEW